MTEQRVRKSQAGPPPRNVAEAKRAEASLRFELTVLGQVAEAVVAIDSDQRTIYMNPAAERRYGVAAEEARGRRLDEVYEYHWLNPGDEASAQQALAVAGFWQGENLHNRRDGTRIHVESSVSLLKDESGRPTGMLAVIRDVTERKQAEEQLRLTEQRFARFMQHLPGLAWIKDLSGRYVFANDATARVFGMSPVQLFGKTDTDLFPPEVTQQFQENDRRALQSEAGIQAVETGGQATVSVKDNGVGIPAYLLPYVFEMFTRINRPLERTQGGLGIGLSIVKRLVEMHGGTVEAHSDGPGAGNEFIVHLPAPASSLAAAQPPVDEATGTDASDRRRILIADDNSDSAASLAIMLKMTGNEVRTARDGVEAFEVAQVFRPELVLLDIGMPRLNGYDTCRLIREQLWGADIKIAAMTGWGQDEDKRRSQEAGFTYHLVKPVEPNALARLLAGLSRTSA